MNCKKCKADISDDFIFCPWCGAKQIREPLKNKKRPNGTGCVRKLSGRRRKPWAAIITKNDKHIYIGYYEARTEALQALNSTTTDTITERYNQSVERIYEDWKALHFEGLTESGEQGYKSAWTYFTDIKNLKMREIKTDTLQQCISQASEKGKTRSVCEKIKQLASQLCKFAMQQDLISKNYAQFLVLPKSDEADKEIFTDDEIALISAHSDDSRAKMVLMLIYTGFRIEELLGLETANVHIAENYLVGGLKTEAGKNRTVPINPKIKPFIEKLYKTAVEHNYKYLIVNSLGGKKVSQNFRNREFYPLLEELEIQEHVDEEHPPRLTPHSCRHTFASLAVKAGVKPEVLQAIIGHANYSTTADVYVHEDMSELQSGMKLI